MNEVVNIKFIKKTISVINKLIINTINEFLVLLGLGLLVLATYSINEIAAMYLMGAILILIGLFLAMTRRE